MPDKKSLEEELKGLGKTNKSEIKTKDEATYFSNEDEIPTELYKKVKAKDLSVSLKYEHQKLIQNHAE